MHEQDSAVNNNPSMACTEFPAPASTKLPLLSGFRAEIGPIKQPLASSKAASLEALTSHLSLNQKSTASPDVGEHGEWGFLSGLTGVGTTLHLETQTNEVDKGLDPGPRQAAAEALQGRSSEDNDEDGRDGDAAQEDDGDERFARLRQKNRRAQQRFRQRQKAKLQAKELESFQLQKQLQDAQAQMASMQIQGTPPDMRLQLARMQAQNQALQVENAELRLLAARLLDENTSLKAVAQKMQVQAGRTAAMGHSSQDNLPSVQSISTAQSAMPPFLSQQQPESYMPGIPRPVLQQRAAVWKKVRQLPWQRTGPFLEAGLPVGVSPGATGMAVLVKVLSKSDNGSSTVLVNFPPGFAHDYIIGTDAQVEEALILTGSLTDVANNQTYFPGDYAHVLPGTCHGPYRADATEGCLVLSFTRCKANRMLSC